MPALNYFSNSFHNRENIFIPAMRAVFTSLATILFITAGARAESETSLLVSVPDQRIVVIQNGLRVAEYPVSTSKFGVGDQPRSYSTPLGALQIAEKIGAGAPEG